MNQYAIWDWWLEDNVYYCILYKNNDLYLSVTDLLNQFKEE